MEILENLLKWEKEVLAVTDEQREEGDDSNPIINAEQGPNRFAVMSLFFNDSEGVRVEEDLELNIKRVYFFNDSEEMEVSEGAFYHWAVDFFDENY